MPKVIVDISMSLDGFVAGPNQTLDEPLGEHGEDLHEWAFAAASWRESHGHSGGEDNADSKVIEESIAGTGAVVMDGACSAAAKDPGRTTQMQRAGGETSLRSMFRSSFSHNTLASR